MAGQWIKIMMQTRGKDPAHGKRAAARQRSARTAKAFAVQFCQAHGNVFFAVDVVAVQMLPCVGARQSLCRVK
jgi:hypothetical protein